MYANSSCESGRRIEEGAEIRFGSYALGAGSGTGTVPPFGFSLTARLRGFPFPAGESTVPSPVADAFRFLTGAAVVVVLSSALTAFLRFFGLSCAGTAVAAADFGDTKSPGSYLGGIAFGDTTPSVAVALADIISDSRSIEAGTLTVPSSFLTLAPAPANADNASAALISCSEAFRLSSPSPSLRRGDDVWGVSFTTDVCDDAALGVRERSAVNDLRKPVDSISSGTSRMANARTCIRLW